MEYTAQFTYDCLWRVDGEKRVCTGGHESDGYPCVRYISKIRTGIPGLVYSQYILVGVCRGTSKNGRPGHGHNPKSGVFGTSTSRNQGGGS